MYWPAHFQHGQDKQSVNKPNKPNNHKNSIFFSPQSITKLPKTIRTTAGRHHRFPCTADKHGGNKVRSHDDHPRRILRSVTASQHIFVLELFSILLSNHHGYAHARTDHVRPSFPFIFCWITSVGPIRFPPDKTFNPVTKKYVDHSTIR